MVPTRRDIRVEARTFRATFDDVPMGELRSNKATTLTPRTHGMCVHAMWPVERPSVTIVITPETHGIHTLEERSHTHMKRKIPAVKIRLRSRLGLFGLLLIGAAGLSTGCGNFVARGDIDVGVQAFRDYMPDVSQEIPIGEATMFDDLAVTVVGVRATDGRDNGGRHHPIPAGHLYLLVNVLMENQGDRQEDVSTRMNFGLFDSMGKSQEWAFYPGATGSIDGRIDPGQERTGELAWKVAENAKGLKLVYGHVAFSIGEASGYRPGSPD